MRWPFTVGDPPHFVLLELKVFYAIALLVGDLYTVIKAFSCMALLPVILGIITSNNCEFLAGLDYQYLLVQVPVITGSITTSVFTKYYW